MDFKGKVIVVTGTSSGMGKSCAEMLLKSGAAVYGFDIKDSLYLHLKKKIFWMFHLI